MRNRSIVLRLICALLTIQALHPLAARAGEAVDPVRQEGEDRWVPSLAITSGVTVQQQNGFADSLLFEDGSPDPVPLQGMVDGNDIAVSPFVGGSLELMTPAFDVATRPRLFVSGEILPTFASDRAVALEGDPGCIRGPRAGSPCVSEMTEIPTFTFAENAANGQGTSLKAQVETLVFGATVGVSFPVRYGKRQLRIKPSIGWINYEISAEGLVVDAACDPVTACTPRLTGMVPPTVIPGFLRETTLTGSGSQFFNGIGPGVDVEMDAGRYGPVGVALFAGLSAYRILGDRTLTFDASQSFDDQLGMDVATASFKVKVDPWLFRGNVGIRFQWFGSPD